MTFGGEPGEVVFLAMADRSEAVEAWAGMAEPPMIYRIVDGVRSEFDPDFEDEANEPSSDDEDDAEDLGSSKPPSAEPVFQIAVLDQGGKPRPIAETSDYAHAKHILSFAERYPDLPRMLLRIARAGDERLDDLLGRFGGA